MSDRLLDQINAGVAAADKAIFFADEWWMNSPYSWEPEAVQLLKRGVRVLAFLSGDPEPLRERIEAARGKSTVTYCLLESTDDLAGAMKALESFLSCKLTHPTAPAQADYSYGLGVGPVSFRMDGFGWTACQPPVPGHAEERSGPVLRKTCGKTRLDLSFVVSKTGLRRAQLDLDLADSDTWKSHHKVFEYGVALAQSILLGKMDRMRELPGFAEKERALSPTKKVRGFLASWLMPRLMGYKPEGVHLLSVCGFNQFAMTYQLHGRWTRKYLVWVPDPQGGSDFELTRLSRFRSARKKFPRRILGAAGRLCP